MSTPFFLHSLMRSCQMMQVSINFTSPKQSIVSENVVEWLVSRFGFSVLVNTEIEPNVLTITRFCSDSRSEIPLLLKALGMAIEPLMGVDLDFQVTFHSLPTLPATSAATAPRSSARSGSNWMKDWEERQNSSSPPEGQESDFLGFNRSSRL